MRDLAARLAAKTEPPAVGGLVRDRLVATLQQRTGLVVAPAGHGKTTLLAHLAAASDGPTAWYRAEAGDRDPRVLLERLRQALGSAAGLGAQLREPQAPWPRTGRRPVDDGPWILNGPQPSPPFLLVIDDFHELAGSAAAGALLGVVSRTPPGCRVLIGARGLGDLDVDLLRLSGTVAIIDADDLRFRSWEVERLFREVYRAPLRPEDAATLAARTEGWAAALVMFRLITAQRPPSERRAALAELTRSPRLLRTYLLREVLGDLPEDVRAFLRTTCTLHELTGPRCDTLLRQQGSQRVLEELAARQLFTTTVDGYRYRYHTVLQDHLELELTDLLGHAGAKEAFHRAGTVLEADGASRAAFRAYVRAEEWPAVQRLLRDHGADVVQRPLGSEADALPAALADRDPWLVLAAARSLASRGSLARAAEGFARAAELATDGQLPVLARGEQRRLSLWLPGTANDTHAWEGLVRAATRHRPEHVLAEALKQPGCQGLVASGAAALCATRFDRAASLFRAAAEHPDADRLTVQLGVLGAVAALLLAGTAISGAAGDLEQLLQSEAELSPFWARIGWALLMALEPDPTSIGRLTEAAERDGDPWGAACTSLLHGIVSRDRRLLDAAAERFDTVDAPVPAHWARWLAELAEGPRSQPDRRTALSQRDRELGMRGVGVTAQLCLDATATVTAEDALDEQVGGDRRDDRPDPGGTDRAGDPPPAAPVAPVLHLRLLGCFSLSLDGRDVDLGGVRPRARAVLKLLALRAGNTVHRDVLVAALWPDLPEEAGYRSLQVAVSSLRRAMEPDAQARRSRLLCRQGDAYRLNLPPGSGSDLLAFESALDRAREARRDRDRPGQVRALREALRAYGGDLLPEQGNDEWVGAERDRLRLAAADAAESLAELEAGAGEVEEALAVLRRCLDLDPFRDSAWRALIALHDGRGDRAAAQTARSGHRQVLLELGLDPQG